MPPRKSSRMTGAGFLSRVKSIAIKAAAIAKEHKLISRALTAVGHPKLGAAAALAGYGKRRRRKRVVRRGTIIV